jgi:hypothetical protein
LTKKEIEMILSGYPPYYRETVLLDGAFPIPFPIQKESEIRRAGWVLLVGFSSVKPLALYRADTESEYDTRSSSAGQAYRDAVKRVTDVLSTSILPKFPDNQNVSAALNAILTILGAKTSSGTMFRFNGPINEPRPTPAQYNMVIKIFDDYRELSPQEVEDLSPILNRVLAAAFKGSRKVIDYLKDNGKGFTLPKMLREHGRSAIYVRGCNKGED